MTADPRPADVPTVPAGQVWRPALLAMPGPVAGPGPAGRVGCDLCPHRCVLAMGETGPCGVRRNREGRLETAAFTVAVSHLDAIERKPLYHVRPGERVLTVAGPGCTFRCNYCVNHRLSQFGRVMTAPWTGAPADPAALVARAVDAGASVGLSYTEPSLALELTVALAEHARPANVPLLWKSNGFLTPAAAAVAAPLLDAVNIDVKAASEPAHQRLTGAPLAPVWDTIEALRAAGVWVEVSTPLIPGISAEPDALAAIARRLAAVDVDIPWHLVRFTPDFRMRRPAPTSPGELRRAVELGTGAGLRFVYVERALGAAGRATCCPGCGATMIERGVWETTTVRLAGGGCPQCGRSVPGRWHGGGT